MTLFRVRLFSICFAFHFLLILAVSIGDTFWALAEEPTKTPASLRNLWRTGEGFTAGVLGDKLSYRNPIRQMLHLYLQSAGIEGGYGYFAPNVPEGCRLSFELRYPDGRVWYDLPHVNSPAAGLRVAGLLDRLTRPGYFPVREYAIRLIANSVWRDHPDVTAIHATFDSIQLPSIAEYQRGEPKSYETLCEYDFRKDESVVPKRE